MLSLELLFVAGAATMLGAAGLLWRLGTNVRPLKPTILGGPSIACISEWQLATPVL
jgi:hypothetical protein